MKVITKDSVLKDNKPKLIVGKLLNNQTEQLKKISGSYSIVGYEKDNDIVTFFNIFEDDDKENLFLSGSKYLPSNVIAFYNVDDEEIKTIIGKHIKEIDLNSENILMELLRLERDNLNNKVYELEKEKYEIRALLENTKNTLQELSIITSSGKLPYHKLELSFEPEESNVIEMKSNVDYLQYLPISSLYVSAIRLYFDIDDYLLYETDDILYVTLLTQESKSTVGHWEVPIKSLENEVILELVTPFIKEKETLILSLRHNSEESLNLKLSKDVFFDKLKLKINDEGSENIIADAPVAMQVYKTIHTFSILNSPFIKKYEKIFEEFDRYLLSENILYNITIIQNNEFFEDVEFNFNDNILITKLKTNMCALIKNVLTPYTEGIIARVNAKGNVKIGILNLIDLEAIDYLDDNYLKELEKEGYFSGWKKVGSDLTTVSLFMPNKNKAYSNLVLIVKNLDEKECIVNWHNFEIIANEIKG